MAGGVGKFIEVQPCVRGQRHCWCCWLSSQHAQGRGIATYIPDRMDLRV